jgi:hypothetical protein
MIQKRRSAARLRDLVQEPARDRPRHHRRELDIDEFNPLASAESANPGLAGGGAAPAGAAPARFDLLAGRPDCAVSERAF